MDTLFQDVRYAARGLVRNPAFALLTVLCLALGIGINSAVFSMADTVSLAPLPFDHPERLVVLYSFRSSSATDRGPVSYQDLRDWKEQARSFSDVAAHGYRSMSITEGVESERFAGSVVTWNLFPMLGEHPVLGRDFTEEDDRPGAPPVVMLSDGLWRRRFAADPSIVGRSIIVNGTVHAVAGVMRPRFQFPQVSEIWTPLVPLEHASARGERTLYPVARLLPGAAIESASRDVAGIATRLERVYRENESWTARAAPLRDELMPVQLRLATAAMLGAVSLVLAIACANVANLLLARATGRQREMAVRTALGAGRWRLVRQLLTESVILGLISAPLGVLIAYALITSITRTIPPAVIIPYYFVWTVNPRVIAYTTFVSAMTGLVFGLVPAVQAGRASITTALKDGDRRARNRLRAVFVVAEVALSLMLLVGASMFVRSVLNIYNSEVGFDTRALMTLRLFMTGDGYATPEAITARANDLVQRIESLPGVTAAFASNLVPLSFGGGSAGIVPEGITVEAGKEPSVTFFATTAHALDTLSQTMRAGRNFTDAEASTRSRTAIVNQALANRAWPGRADSVGRRFRFTSDPPDEWFTVIGVVSDFQPLLLRDRGIVEPLAILPFPYQAMRDTGITIRVSGVPPASITSSARQAIGQSDPTLALFNIRTGDENRGARLWAPLFLSWMFSIFGSTALFLAAIGIYGVLSYSVALRTREFAVRVALGASRRSILALVARQGTVLTAVGIAAGSAGAFVVTRLVRALLYNVTPTDPVSFGGTAFVLAAIAVLAGLVPARRATRVDPIVALRAE
jgi:putative ABC transport system permease protein